MATKDQRFERDLAKYARGLDAFLSADKIHKHAVVRHAKEVINVVIGTAKAGIGPDGPYAEYSDSYKKQLGLKQVGGDIRSSKRMRASLAKSRAGTKGRYLKAQRAGRKLWLVGGAKPDMLDRNRFYWKIREKSGKLFLMWGGAVYGLVHQGAEYGGQDHTGNIPARPWMRLDSPGAIAAVNKMYKLTLADRAAEFNRGQLK